MGRLKYFVLLIAVVLITGCSLFTKTWIYRELPNDYAIQKTSDTEMVVGKYIDDIFEIEEDGTQIGFESYVSEFQKGERYVGFKCAASADEGLELFFYIVDTQESDVYGPYSLESTYEAVKEKIVDEELGEWIKTSSIKE